MDRFINFLTAIKNFLIDGYEFDRAAKTVMCDRINSLPLYGRWLTLTGMVLLGLLGLYIMTKILSWIGFSALAVKIYVVLCLCWATFYYGFYLTVKCGLRLFSK